MYLSALLLFGLNGIVASRINMPSHEIVFFRTGIAGIALTLLFVAMDAKFTFWRHPRAFAALCVSGIAMGVSWMFLYEAYRLMGVGVAFLFYCCGPVVVMAMSPLLFGGRLTKAVIAAFMAVFAGVVCVNGMASFGGTGGWRLVCGVMSALMYAVMVIANKKAAPITGLENASLQVCVSFLTVAAFLAARQGFTVHPSSGDWPWLVVLGVVNTALGCYLFFAPLSRLRAQTVAVCGCLEPLSAVVFAAMLLGERLTAAQLAGGVLIIGGALSAELLGRLPPSRDGATAKPGVK